MEAPAANVCGSAPAAGERMKSELLAPESTGSLVPLAAKLRMSLPVLVTTSVCGAELVPAA